MDINRQRFNEVVAATGKKFTVKKSIDGYFCLLDEDEKRIINDSACEDLYDEGDAIAYFTSFLLEYEVSDDQKVCVGEIDFLKSWVDKNLSSEHNEDECFAVCVYDNNCNTGHDTGYYAEGDYSWVDKTLNDTDIVCMTKEAAYRTMADFEELAKEKGLEWCSFEVVDFSVDVLDED